MYDVVVYLSSLNKQEPGRKVESLTAFADGARAVGANVLVETRYIHRPAKLAVILGWPSPLPVSTNIKFRQEIVNTQQQHHNHTMGIDANCFKFVDHQSKYLRYGIDGEFYNTGEFANANSNNDKWNQISKEFNLTLKDWKTTGDYILFLVQREGGWGMKGTNTLAWVKKKIEDIRKNSDLPIRLRPHPGKVTDLKSLIKPGITISDSVNVPIVDELQNAKAALVFNSSSGVPTILEGVPLWVDDQGSTCWDVANKDISQFNNPVFFDRTQWIRELAGCHWTDNESRQGVIYKKFLPYLT